jgi:hypothetical protein
MEPFQLFGEAGNENDGKDVTVISSVTDSAHLPVC